MKPRHIESLEIDLLLEAIQRRYGYDFRHYARASLLRRVNAFLTRRQLDSPSQLIPMVLHDRSVFESLVYHISVTVTELFRDPEVYRKIRQEVVPYLKTYPYIKIWNAGCATGEEAYAMAILLTEEGLYDRCQIYATDMNNQSLAKAKQGIYDIANMQQYTRNHRLSGGSRPFSDFYRSRYDTVIMDRAIKKNIVFASHNLSVDHSFGEMHFIMCRNVLIYFNQKLQDRVLKLFYDSLIRNGLLCLGTKESIRFSYMQHHFQVVAEKEKIFRRQDTIGPSTSDIGYAGSRYPKEAPS